MTNFSQSWSPRFGTIEEDGSRAIHSQYRVIKLNTWLSHIKFAYEIYIPIDIRASLLLLSSNHHINHMNKHKNEIRNPIKWSNNHNNNASKNVVSVTNGKTTYIKRKYVHIRYMYMYINNYMPMSKVATTNVPKLQQQY